MAVRDLAAINVTLPHGTVSAADRLRFLVEYARARGWRGGMAVRRLARRVLGRSAHIAGRSKFRGIDWRGCEGK